MSRPVDLDLLADYAAGTLDPIAAGEVADLLQGDSRWNRAYIALIQADLAVRADLSAMAATEDMMPAAVNSRLEEVIKAATRASVHPTGATPQPSSTPVTPRTPPPASSDAGQARPRHHVVPVSRGRRRRTVAFALSAAATVALAVGGIAMLGVNTSMTAAPGLNIPGSAEKDNAISTPAGGRTSVLSSGTDYRTETLGQLPTLAGRGVLTAGPRTPAPVSGEGSPPYVGAPDSPQIPEAVRDAVAGPLTRLTDPGALADCLAAVGQTHPGTVGALDFARFNGAPALLLLITSVGGTTVVVVGPDCGRADADELASAPIS